VGVVFGLKGVGGFERGQGDLLVFVEGVGIHSAIMENSPIKEPRPPQEDMAHIHGHHITPNLILIAFSNGM